MKITIPLEAELRAGRRVMSLNITTEIDLDDPNSLKDQIDKLLFSKLKEQLKTYYNDAFELTSLIIDIKEKHF